MVANRKDYRDRAHDCDRAPGNLAHPRAVPARVASRNVDAVDHCDADAIERGGDGEDEWVGVARHEAHDDMQAEDQDRQAGAEQNERGVDVSERAELHEHNGTRIDRTGDDEQK